MTIETLTLPKARPFIKFVGGKTKLLGELRRRLPPTWGTYHEPFVGGGALFFDLAGDETVRYGSGLGEARLSDMNGELVETYRAIRDDVDAVIAILREHAKSHSKTFYEALRDDNDADFVMRETQLGLKHCRPHVAARMIYLNKTGFNGLYRVNRKGEFNVGWGKREKYVVDEKNLRACSVALQHTHVTREDFVKVRERAEAGDLVYLDSPYYPLGDKPSFVAYTKEGFDLDDHARLAMLAIELDSRGVNVVLSNAGAGTVRGWYSQFDVFDVMAPRAVNSKGSGRGEVAELIIASRRIAKLLEAEIEMERATHT